MSSQDWTNLAAIGGFAIALVALAQPWAVWAWRKWIRKGRVGIYESRFSRIGVGFTGNGATLDLTFTIRAINHDQFVRQIGVSVIRNRDKAMYDYEWRVFHSFLHHYGSFQEPVELPASLLLVQSYPRSLRVTFGDVRLEKDMEDIVKRVRTLWVEYRPQIPDHPGDDGDVSNRTPLPPSGDQFLAAAHEAYQKMTHSAKYAEFVKELERRCYWEPGQYTMSIRISTDAPEQEHVKQHRFR